MGISAYPLVENKIFLYVAHLFWVWDFVDMYLTQLGTRIQSPKNLSLFKKLVFLASNTLMSPSSTGEKNMSLNFECNDLVNGKD
jgi:hypothetical protein